MVNVIYNLAAIIGLVWAADYETLPGRATFDVKYSVFTDKYTFKAIMKEKEHFMIAFNKNYNLIL